LFPKEETFIFEKKRKVTERFKVELLDEALEFVENLDEKTREKVIYNIYKARIIQDPNCLKNYLERFGNSELYSKRIISGYLHFGTSQTRLIRL
jgi:hypothetical protein